MPYSVAANYASAMLAHLEQVAYGNAPSEKITPVGYLRMLAENNTGFRIVREGYLENGHIRDVRIAYQTRGTEGNVASDDNCDIDVIPAYTEVTTNITYFAKLGIYIDDRTIARYMDDASALVTPAGSSPAPVSMLMREHLDSIIRQANGIFQKIDRDLLTKQNATWGINAATGLATEKTVDFPIDVTTQALNDGITEIMDDMDLNEVSGRPIIVGAGLFNKYQRQQKVKGLDQGGINTSLWVPDYDYYYDIRSQSIWGTNNIGVFSKGSVILLDYNRYGGSFAGDKLTSFNFKMPLPVVESVTGASLGFFTFDAKIKRIDCPTEVLVGPYDTLATVNEGWTLILSKYYDQFNIPADAYAATDRLTGNNGSFLYKITNT